MNEKELTTYLILGLILLIWTFIKAGTKKNPKVDWPRKTANTETEEQLQPKQQQPKTTYQQVSRDNTKPVVKIATKESVEQEIVTNQTVSDLRNHFDVKKAVIYKELLEPKYKEY